MQNRLLSLAASAAIMIPLLASQSLPVFAQDAQAQTTPADAAGGIPEPAPLIDTTQSSDEVQMAAPVIDDKAEISFDLAKAPEAVQKTRQLILDAARAGDLGKVVALMNPGAEQTDIGPDDTGNDLQTALKDMSGDGEGLEILSIMMDVLSTGFAHVNVGTPDEAYVWPYFTAKHLDKLSPSEKVDLMRLVTAGDYADMLEYGGYNFYRIGITPDGRWKFFLSGN